MKSLCFTLDHVFPFQFSMYEETCMPSDNLFFSRLSVIAIQTFVSSRQYVYVLFHRWKTIYGLEIVDVEEKGKAKKKEKYCE